MIQADLTFSTLVELLAYRSTHQPDRLAYRFLAEGEEETGSYTYSQLDQIARGLATYLREQGIPSGERVLLLYPSSLEFIAAYFGCLYAGVIAVPAYPPRRNQNVKRLSSIVVDAQAQVALTQQTLIEGVQQHFDQAASLTQLTCLPTDHLDPAQIHALASEWIPPEIRPETLAFLQYTSGSTGDPKGVMVSHENILFNQLMIKQAFQHDESTVIVGWLPLFHDMGLIGNVLQPLFLGLACTLMPPTAFLQKPARWLQAISRYRGTTSGGPNFAYDLCASQITDEQKADLDLSCWSVAFNGAEPIRAVTLQRFSAAFADCRFRGEALYPCYGMAEATLLISGGSPHHPPLLKHVQATALEQNQVLSAAPTDQDYRALVGCGHTILDQEILIVDPNTCDPCSMGQIGEVWVSGSHVARGYWGREQTTQETFQAWIADGSRGPYLRTGDLGFLDAEGELYITGRLKDVIIIRGRNHYPQDIESTVENSHPALRAYGGAAFTIEVEGEARLMIAQEVERQAMRRLATEEVIAAIRGAVFQEHNLEIYGISLLRTATLPKTSSGKVQRRTCRELYLNQQLKTVAEWSAPSRKAATDKESPTIPPRTVIEEKLSQIWGELLGLDPAEISVVDSFFEWGGTSLLVTQLSERIEQQFGVQLSLSQLASNASIEAQAKLLEKDELTETGLGTSWTPIVPLQTKGNKSPFFAFHPAFGDAYIYRRLAKHLGSDQPFYAIQGKWLSGETLTDLTIEDLVAEYVEAIKKIQPRGPYQLGGYSGGGILALEAAQQLLQQGESVGRIVLLDCPADGIRVQQKRGKGIRKLWMKLGVITEVFLEFERMLSSGQNAMIRVATIPFKIQWYIRNVIRPTRLAGKLLDPAVLDYVSRKSTFPVSIALIRTERTDYRYTESNSPDLGWSAYADGDVEVHLVKGKHFNLLMEPYVQRVSEKLSIILNQHQSSIDHHRNYLDHDQQKSADHMKD